LAALFFSIANSNSLIKYPIQPYIFGSEPVDLFFPLLATIPFTWPIFFLRKDNFLEYVSMRIEPKTYLRIQAITSLSLCFLMIILVNIAGVAFSLNIANLNNNVQGSTLEGYILGEMQMVNPIKFGMFWSFYKAIIGMLICVLGLTFAFYIKNLFFVFLAPFATVFLENFLTGLTGLSKFSFTTTFVLNRLTPNAMLAKNLMVGIFMFIVVILVAQRILVHYDQQDN
jgi:hypothetical protein